MAPPRGPRGGEKPQGQGQNRDPNRGRDDRRDEQSRAARWQDDRSRVRGRGGQGAGDVRGNPDFPPSAIPKGLMGLLSLMVGKAVNKVKPRHRVIDSVNSKSNNEPARGRDSTIQAEKSNKNRRRNSSPKPARESYLVTVSGTFASRASPLKSTRPQSRQPSPMPPRELPKKTQESSARLYSFESPAQNAPLSKASAKKILAQPAASNTTQTKTSRLTIAPAKAIMQITTPEISCQPRTRVGDAENPFTAPASELPRIMADLRSRIHPGPATQKKPPKISRPCNETAELSLSLDRTEVGRMEKAESENHRPNTISMLESNNVGLYVNKLKEEVAHRAEQESRASINLDPVAKTNAFPNPPAPAWNAGTIGMLLAMSQRPTPSISTEPRDLLRQNKSVPQAPELVPKIVPLVLESWRRDPASLDMTIYRKKMADLYQKVCGTSYLNTAIRIYRVIISPGTFLSLKLPEFKRGRMQLEITRSPTQKDELLWQRPSLWWVHVQDYARNLKGWKE